ncbi:hypothetical protein OAL34_02730, partial [Synechococcus sp. AH-551-G03]|nr:hypothetical protein [Synechococcus sp. AH-551-G03]
MHKTFIALLLVSCSIGLSACQSEYQKNCRSPIDKIRDDLTGFSVSVNNAEENNEIISEYGNYDVAGDYETLLNSFSEFESKGIICNESFGDKDFSHNMQIRIEKERTRFNSIPSIDLVLGNPLKNPSQPAVLQGSDAIKVKRDAKLLAQQKADKQKNLKGYKYNRSLDGEFSDIDKITVEDVE